MSNNEECDAMNQRITDMGTDIHGHLRNLSDKFDSHHDILTNHIVKFDKHEKEEIARHSQFIESQALNTEAINKLSHSTEGLVEAWSTVGGVTKFIKWISGIVIAIVAAYSYYSK